MLEKMNKMNACFFWFSFPQKQTQIIDAPTVFPPNRNALVLAIDSEHFGPKMENAPQKCPKMHHFRRAFRYHFILICRLTKQTTNEIVIGTNQINSQNTN